MIAAKRKVKTKPRRTYHHGDLRAALLAAAWSIVAEEGIEALSLRACARRAGVSHSAPEHHFGNLAGLMEEFAADGYERLGEMMETVGAEMIDQPLLAAGLGYVRFTAAFPEHFRVMSKMPAASANSPRLRTASQASRHRLEAALRIAYVNRYGHEPSPEALTVKAALAWCCVHGYAMLKADGHSNETALPDATAILAELRPSLLTD